MTAPGLLRPSQAAPLLGIAVRTLWDYVAQGVIPRSAIVTVGCGKHRRFKREVLEKAGLIAREVAS